MGKIIVVGSLNMDLVVTTPKFPVMGETILGSGFMTAPGGKGANQAVAAGKLEGDVTMIGCVGNDLFGSSLIESLKSSNVNIPNIVRVDELSTGIAVIVLKDGNNFIIVDPGANFRLSAEMLDIVEEEIKNSSIMVIQLEIPINTVEHALALAKKHKVKVILNPAPARKLEGSILKMVDIITPNETEAEILTGLPVTSLEEAKAAGSVLLSKGIPQVIITLGSKGVIYNNGQEFFHKTVPKVKVVDTTAAGDSFTGAIAVALAQGKNIDEAVDFGNIVGTLTVMKKGAQTSLPTLKEVNDFRL